jgi:hypothetical protein
MKHLDFIVWFLGWPLVISLCDLMAARESKIKGLPANDKDPSLAFAYFVFITWFIIAYALW